MLGRVLKSASEAGKGQACLRLVWDEQVAVKLAYVNLHSCRTLFTILTL